MKRNENKKVYSFTNQVRVKITRSYRYIPFHFLVNMRILNSRTKLAIVLLRTK